MLDILPTRANTLKAVEFLRDAVGVSLANTLFAGDTGNGLQVLTSYVPSVLVAHAMAEVHEEALASVTHSNIWGALYRASGDRYGMNGN